MYHPLSFITEGDMLVFPNNERRSRPTTDVTQMTEFMNQHDIPPSETREVWLRGPLPDVPPLLQPVAHALLQAREEVTALTMNFPDNLLWNRPQDRNGNSMASVGFHLQHLTGVLDRTFTYARQEPLSSEQLSALAAEGNSAQPAPSVQELVNRFSKQVDRALVQLRNTNEQSLTESRGVGRAHLPSTVIGLLVHAAEHTMRHVGQLSVTVRVITL